MADRVDGVCPRLGEEGPSRARHHDRRSSHDDCRQDCRSSWSMEWEGNEENDDERENVGDGGSNKKGGNKEDETASAAEEEKEDVGTSAFETGPKFHVHQRVLCLDWELAESKEKTNKKKSMEMERIEIKKGDAIDDNGDPPPLYEAIVRRSCLRCVHPRTGKVLPETRFASSNRNRRRGCRLDDRLARPRDDPSALSKQWCHLIHFRGWNSRWDRWMKESDIFPDTPENRKRVPPDEDKGYEKNKNKQTKDDRERRRLLAEACTLPFTLQTVLVDDRDKITRKVHPPPTFFRGPSSPSGGGREGLTMLHELPAATTIRDVMAHFVRIRKREDREEFARDRETKDEASSGAAGPIEERATASFSPASRTSTMEMLQTKKRKRKEFALSLLALVDVALPLFLLYREERDQSSNVMHGRGDDEADGPLQKRPRTDDPLPKPSEVYGAEHLLRLFVRLPLLLSRLPDPSTPDAAENSTSSEDEGKDGERVAVLSSEERSRELADFLSELIAFLQRHRDSCFRGKYFAVESKK